MSDRFADRLEGIGLSMIRQIMLQARGCINLGIGQPEFFAPAVVREQAQRVLEREPILYTPNVGLAELCRAVAEYHGNLPGHSATVTNGSQEALFDLFFALLNPGDEILLPDPGFVAYATVARLAGARVVRYRLNRKQSFAFSLQEFRSKLTPRTRVALVNSPSNPTAQCLSAIDLKAVAELCQEREIHLVSDEIYREIYFGSERPASLVEVAPKAIILSGVSKMASMTGWRVGWVYGPEAVVNKATIMHQYTSSCASSLAQKAALALFTETGRAGIASIRERLDEQCKTICGWLTERMGDCFVPPQGAFYLMLDVNHLRRPSLEIALELIHHGVAVIPGSAFGSEGEGFLRLSFAGSPDNLIQGLERIKRGLDHLSA